MTQDILSGASEQDITAPAEQIKATPRFIPYNTGMKKLVLPEYGRNIQQMADYCLTIEDREERTRCAFAIVDVMATLFPDLVGDDGRRRKLWDHLNIMTDCKLDIDFPVSVADKDSLHPKPAKIPYASSHNYHRQYGRLVPQMAEIIADMPDSPEKDAMVSMIAHHMKKLLLVHNKEGVSNARVLHDLFQFSKGKLDLDPDTYILHDFLDPEPQAQGKNKKKKKK